MNSKKVAEMFDITIDTIRYYERIGVIPPIKRDKNGYRIYTKRDLNWIFLAKSLRNAGLSINSLVEFATLAQMDGDKKFAQKEILNEQLIEIDNKIEEMNTVRDLLHYKLDTYDDHIAKFKTDELSDDNVEELWNMEHFRKEK